LSARAIGLYIPAMTDGSAVAQAGELVALVDIDEKRLATFLERENLNIPGFAPGQFDRMVDETRPDCVIVTTPDGTHVDYIVAALGRDLDVICEKPMVIDCEQAKRVFAAESTSKGTLQVTHNSRYTPGHMLVKRMISDGLVGRITNVDLSWNIDTYHGASYFYRWNRDRAKSGGMSITKGCHHFDLLNWWIDDIPEEVFAFGALNYYGAKSPHNPSVKDGVDYSPMEQRDRCAYHNRWFAEDTAPPAEDRTGTPGSGKHLPNEKQYPAKSPIYLYDESISIEDTYSAVIRYRGGASVSYSANFSAPWEGYTLVINGTHGRIEKTERLDRGVADPGAGRESVAYYPIFGELEVHEAEQASGTHGGADPLLIQNLFVEPIPETDALGLTADSSQAAYAVAVGEAVWRSVTEHRLIRIPELLGRDISK
jgi:predicted dehydrogenase